MAFDTDPVGSGVVASLARPGGNVTGLSSLAPEVSAKQLELLKEVVPKLSRVALLGDSTQAGTARSVKESESAAGKYGLQVQFFDVADAAKIEPAMHAAAVARAGAIVILSSAVFNSQRAKVVAAVNKSRLPHVYPFDDYVREGGLMSYGVNYREMFRRAATYVDKILKGAKPGDLPVEQPTKLDLVVSVKAAKNLGLTVPRSLLLRADELIE
jgi:putative ABC transport system substrate-binding protein